jgi:hypothetical protein
MKIASKILIAAVLSLTTGIAFAAPLFVTDINIRPWINHVQGPTSEFEVNVVYANFTIQNASIPITQNDGPTISYYVVVNVTNPSDLGARLSLINFVAAQKITNSSGFTFASNGTYGQGWAAESAWVDGKWYNITWANGFYPNFDRNGTMVPPPFNMSNYPSRWIAGVQVYDWHVNGTLTTYMNMNGTWTDVTGRIDVYRPPAGNSSYIITSPIVNEMDMFESASFHNYTSNGVSIDPAGASTISVHHLVGNGLFDNYWAPNQWRLIALSGSWNIRKPYANAQVLNTLESGNLTLKTQTTNYVDKTLGLVNNTAVDTWSYATELKQVQLTRSGDSYLYNNILSDNQVFQADQWGVEVFVKQGR